MNSSTETSFSDELRSKKRQTRDETTTIKEDDDSSLFLESNKKVKKIVDNSDSMPPLDSNLNKQRSGVESNHFNFVIKRDGRKEPVSLDKITKRLSELVNIKPELMNVNITEVVLKVISGIYPNIHTHELDTLAAETAAYSAANHPNYSKLAARIFVSNLHKQTNPVWSEVVEDLYKNCFHPVTKEHIPMVSDELYELAMKHKDRLNGEIDYARDYQYDYFGLKTLERSYLIKAGLEKTIKERPQHMLMRVSLGIHGDDIEKVVSTYHTMSQLYFTHASPTLFNSGTTVPQFSSCFLLTMKDDSLDGIYDTIKQCAMISKSGGGIGLNVHKIRASGSLIRKTGGNSNGLIPMLRVFNDTARYVDQGGCKRPGAFAIYLEPWHADIFDFLNLRKNNGKEELRCRDLFYALWIPDLFMKRVQDNASWSLFCPDECQGLSDVHSEEFEKLYLKYESEGKAKRTVRAQDLWGEIITSQIETGTPYMLYKDACNKKSNQKNLGTIKCSNLCTEIVQYSSPEEIAVCNLASVSLPAFYNPTIPGKFDHQKLYNVVKDIVFNMNKIIHRGFYAMEEARRSNMRHKPMGLGVQGLANLFLLLRLPFDSEEALRINAEIFETIYFAALSMSREMAKIHGTYESYPGSPISQGILQMDFWEGVNGFKVHYSGRWDWVGLRRDIKEDGVLNSLLVAPMPTASTSQILGNNESVEPYTSNLYTRRVLAGDFMVVNEHLIKDLENLGLWNESMKNRIIAEGGSIQKILEIPQDVRDIYKIVSEISIQCIIDMAEARSPFIDQSQSLNIHMNEPNFDRLSKLHFYTWKKGLKTGMYYLRTQPATKAIQFTVDQNMLKLSTSTSNALSNQKNGSNETIVPQTNEKKKRKIDDFSRGESSDGDKEEEEEEISKKRFKCETENGDSCVMCSG